MFPKKIIIFSYFTSSTLCSIWMYALDCDRTYKKKKILNNLLRFCEVNTKHAYPYLDKSDLELRFSPQCFIGYVRYVSLNEVSQIAMSKARDDRALSIVVIYISYVCP